MILKHADDKQGDIDILHNLAARASSPRQRSDIQSEIDNIVSGMRGEADASYYLDQEFRHREDIIVIHDLRIEEEGDIAQIDHIVINRHRQAIVLETKALKAEISCNDDGEWEAVYGKQRYSIASPLEQCKRHASVLRRWLARRKTALREVIPVVLVAPTTRLGQRKSERDDPEVIKSDLFTRWLDNHQRGTSTLIGSSDDKMSEDELAGIGYRLVRAHTPVQFDWRKRFGFPSTMDIEDGGPDKVKEKTLPKAPPPTAQNEEKPERRKHVGKTEVGIAGGNITVFRYEDGDRGIRCDDDSLKEKVAEACRRHSGRWVPFPKFWLVSFDACRAIIGELGGQVAARPIAAAPPAQLSVKLADVIPTVDTIPELINTPHGDITIKRTKLGYAIRNPYQPAIIEIVKEGCQGRGRWNGMYKNWLVGQEHIHLVVDKIQNLLSKDNAK